MQKDYRMEIKSKMRKQFAKKIAKKRLAKVVALCDNPEYLKLMIPLQLNDAIITNKIKVDMGGHFKNDALIFDYNRLVMDDNIPVEQILQLRSCLEGNANRLDKSIQLECSRECSECGQSLIFETNGKKLKCTTPCPYPNGYPDIVFELNVPSGKMVVANDLRAKFCVVGNYDIMGTFGIAQTSLKYAESGLAHAFVGNTCPTMYKFSDTKFTIGVQGVPKSRGKKARRVASICTDLWWYSIADYDEFQKRYQMKPEDYKQGCFDIDIVKCTPGVYRFTHRYHKADRDDYKTQQTYTIIQRIRKSDVQKDIKSYDQLNIDAGQVIYDAIAGYPTLFSEKYDFKTNTKTKLAPDSNEAIQSAARHIMTVGGNGYDYHPNGWLGDNPDMNEKSPSVEIPIFKGQYDWYPFTGYSFIACASGIVNKSYMDLKSTNDIHLNPSFTSLLFNILHCMCKYGVKLSRSGQGKEYDKKQKASTEKWAWKCLRAAVKKYPDRVPDYCKKLMKSKVS